MSKTRLLRNSLLLLCAAALLGAPATTQTRRGLQPSDLALFKEISDAQISPDGSRVVYVVSEASLDRAQLVAQLWLVPLAGGEPRRMTVGDANHTTPRWSPDGKWIAFYSNRDKRDGLWMLPVEGGEPRLVTRLVRTNFYLNRAGESFTWSPDSKKIAFLSAPEILSEAAPNAASNAAEPKQAGVPAQLQRPLTREEIERLPAEVREMIYKAQGRAPGQATGAKPSAPVENALSHQPDDPRVITRLQYKSRTSFTDNLQSHIFTVDVETRQLRQLTNGPHYEHSINWSPRGDEIAFVSNREPDPDRNNNTDLFTVNVNTLAVRQLTKTKGCEWQPAFAPDGSEIAYLATKREITTIDSVAEDTQAYVIPAPGGEPRGVSQAKDRRVSTLKWAPQSKDLYYLISDQGRTTLWTMRQGQARPFFEQRAQISSFSFGRDGALALIYSDPTHPAELYATAPSQNSGVQSLMKPLGNANRALLAQIALADLREFRFNNEGFEVQGWVMLPPHADDKKKYPVLLSIHGGPHGMHGYGFNANAQALAAQGYAVLLINPRGSTGYGQKFADGCLNDWGGGDYRDLMKGVDEALRQFPALDKDRLGVLGGSYGGYMTNWVVTQTDRFKAGVASASLANLISFYSTSLYQDLIHAEFNGQPWDNFDLLWERSPLKHIKQAKTPLLLIHGEQDNDVHITQAEEMYTALKMRGVATVFLRYPREGHGFREPRHRIDVLARTVQWFDRYLK